MCALMVVLFVLATFAIFTLGWHLVVPEYWYWLKDDELQEIKNFVLSGAMVGVGTAYIRRYLDDRTRPPNG